VGDVEIRLLVEPPDLEAAAEVINVVWDDPTLASPSLLRAYTHFGNPTLGAFVAGRLVGVSVAFLAPSGGTHLHSHITGLLPEYQHLGLGHRLKLEQRAWCEARGITEVTWTFDPMLARNAHFNLRKLGAVAEAVLPAFYGAMNDGLNRGDVTDRLEVHWHLVPAATAPERAGAIRTVAIPEDYAALRIADPEQARIERKRVCEELVDGFRDGLVIVDFNDRYEYEFAHAARHRSASDGAASPQK
jgi:predicted GNAT superfamily acetyltransferase